MISPDVTFTKQIHKMYNMTTDFNRAEYLKSNTTVHVLKYNVVYVNNPFTTKNN